MRQPDETATSGDDGSVFGAEFRGKPIAPDAVGRYRAELTSDEIAIVEKISGLLQERYGYG